MPYKILISCYACDPYQGSEPGMGWNFISGIGQHHELHIITESKFQKSLEQKRMETPEVFCKLHFYFIEKERHKTLRKLWPPSYYFFYKQWQKKAYNLALKLNKIENFDLVHQLNMVGFREPGYLWRITKPFVWGPIGGLQNTHFKLLFNLDLKSFIYYSLRNVINIIQVRCNKRSKLAAKHPNSILISATDAHQIKIKKYWGRESFLIPEVGQENTFKESLLTRKENDPLIIIWSGQHIAHKALNILIKSLSGLPKNIRWKLTILGYGKMTEKWKYLTTKYNVDKCCEWCGWIDKVEAHKKMQESHLLCITSLKDETSTITLEGLSFGLPVICIDHFGFSNVVNESCGIKIPIDFPQKLIQKFSDAITKIYENENYRQALSSGAIIRSKNYSWKGKINKLNDIYSSLMKQYEL